MELKDVREIIIHCSATPASMDIGVEEIRQWHVEERGWSDIGYHYVIRRDGTLEKGRPLTRMGAHVRGRNKNTIGICLVGGHGGTVTDSFLTNFTREQEDTLVRLIDELRNRIKDLGAEESVMLQGHNRYANKACPCFQVPAWWTLATNNRIKLTARPIEEQITDLRAKTLIMENRLNVLEELLRATRQSFPPMSPVHLEPEERSG